VSGQDADLLGVDQLRARNRILIARNDENVEKAKKAEYYARISAYIAGMFGVLLPFFLWTLISHQWFDGNLEDYALDHRWVWMLSVGIFTASWKGMHYLTVGRHNPDRKKND